MSELFAHNSTTVASDNSGPGALTPVKIQFARIYLCLILGLLIPPSLVMGINYFNDSFAIFHDDRDLIGPANLNFVRMKYLIESGAQHKVVLLGSSRTNVLDIGSHISESAYTISIPGGYTDHHLRNLNALIERGIVPDMVLLGLGEAAIQVPEEGDAKRRNYNRLHPIAEGTNPLFYYWDYLTYIPSLADLLHFRNRLSRTLRGSHVISEHSLRILHTGRLKCIQCEDRALQRSDDEHVAALAKTIRGYRPKAIKVSGAIDSVRMIVDLADAHDISLFIFIDPIYQAKYLSDDVPSWMEFKRELIQVTSFLDFSNFNSTFATAKNFVDPIHYNQETGARIMTDIRSGLDGRVDDIELGTWVTPENVDGYLQKQQDLYLSLQQ